MKKRQLITGAGIVLLTFGISCNNPRTADNSIEQAEAVNDTMAMTNEDDADFAVKAADASLAEVDLGKLAVERAVDPRVKAFAQHMIDGHQKANEELMSIAIRLDITLPPVVSEDQANKQMQLRDETGADFDRAYMDRMVKDHNQAVSLFEDAASDARNPDLQAFATKTLPTLKKHHEEAKALQDSIRPMDSPIVPRSMP